MLELIQNNLICQSQSLTTFPDVLSSGKDTVDMNQISRCFLPVLTQPAGEISKGHQVVVLLVQQGEGAVCQRVGVLGGDHGPRRQQPV